MDRVKPNDINAEQSVLGSILIDNESFYEVDGYLIPETFYYESNRYIYQSIKNLFTDKKHVDLVTVKDELINNKKLDAIGGVFYLTKLFEHVPTAKNVNFHGKIILKLYQQRKLIQISQKIIQDCFDRNEPIDIISSSQKEINKLLSHDIKKDFVVIKDLIQPFNDRLDRNADGELKKGMKTGFIDIDKKLLLRDEELIIIAARPGMGKTSMALNIAYNVSLLNKNIAMFSMEMSRDLLMDRLVASVGEIPLDQIANGITEDHNYKKLSRAIGSLCEKQIFIDDTERLNTSEIRAKLIKLQREKGIDLLIIDYLGLIGGNSREGRRELVSQNVREIKSICREMKLPIILLCQLNRDVEGRAVKEPMLSDLKETGEIEQTADVVIFIARDRPDAVEAKVIIAKQRNGGTGFVQMLYRPELTKFYSVEKKNHEDWNDK